MTVRSRSIGNALVALAASLLAGCAATPSRIDPFEPMNRGMFQIHTAVDEAVMRPAIQMYIDVVPDPVRQAVSNFFNNIDDMVSVVNDLLQGKIDKAGNDMGRVMLNTTWGLGGLVDLASMVGIERGNEDFGQTFGVWGFDQGPYLFVPILGPTTFRDGTGWIVRAAWGGPVGYIPDVAVRNVIYGVGAVDLRAQLMGTTKLVDTAALDRYLFIRNAYLQRRRYLVYDGKPPPEKEEE
ncbi:MAG: VacJ family lipoprotein [Betaproteobacteria bacterium]